MNSVKKFPGAGFISHSDFSLAMIGLLREPALAWDPGPCQLLGSPKITRGFALTSPTGELCLASVDTGPGAMGSGLLPHC